MTHSKGVIGQIPVSSSGDARVAELLADWGQNLDSALSAMEGNVAKAADGASDLQGMINQNRERVQQAVAEQRQEAGDRRTMTIVITEPEAGEIDPEQLTSRQLVRAQQAKQALEWQETEAVTNIQRAREELAKAAAEPSEAVKQVYLKSADVFLNRARSANNDMNRTLATWQNTPQTSDEGAVQFAPAAATVSAPMDFRSPTYQFGQRMAGLEDGTGIVNLDLFDNPSGAVSAAEAVPVPDSWKRSTRTLSGEFERTVIRDPGQAEAIDLGNAGRINLAPITEALASIEDLPEGLTLFESCGAGGQVCPTNEFLNILADPAKKELLRNVGGVALDVVFDMLDSAGVPGMAMGMDIKLIEDPVLISLRTLADEAGAFATLENWSSLPDHLRHPGDVARIIGYVAVPEEDDLVLVGLKAASSDQRIDIDSIILAIRLIWRDGQTIGVSLDPLGPARFDRHIPRVIGVAEDSLPAKIMLDADYLMKAIAVEQNDDGPAIGIANLIRRHFEDQTEGSRTTRFWMTPRKIDRQHFTRSPSGRSALAMSNIQVLTEDTLVLASGRQIGLDRSGPLFQAIAVEIDRIVRKSIDDTGSISSSSEFATPFVLLQGVSDIAVVAKLLRTLGVSYPALQQLSALPYSHFTGDQALPLFYAGLSVSIDRQNDLPYILQGGADLAVRLDGAAHASAADPRLQALETAADQLADAGELTAVVLIALNVSDPNVEAIEIPDQGESASPVTRTHLVGLAKQMLDDGHYEFALVAYRELFLASPARADAHVGMALANLYLGQFDDAMRALRGAMFLEPWERSYDLLAMDIAWRQDDAAALELLGEDGAKLLGDYYTALSMQTLAGGQEHRALTFAGWSVRLWPDSPFSYYARATATSMTKPRERIYDLVRAVRNYRSLEFLGLLPDGPSLADILTDLAVARLDFAANGSALLTDDEERRAFSYLMYPMLMEAREDATEAVELEPRHVRAKITQILARAVYANQMSYRRREAGLEAAIIDLESLFERDPLNPAPLEARAVVETLANDPRAALHTLDRAAEITSIGQGLLIRLARARALFELGMCSLGRSELELARALPNDGFEAQLAFLGGLSESCR